MVTTFTLFSQLPHKLRSKIWHHALPLFPRIIELRHVRSKDGLHNHAPPRWVVFPTSKPTLLCINQESRQILLPHYSSPFQSLRICPHLGIQSLLINYNVDILFINIDSRWPGHSDLLFRNLFGSRFDEVQGNLKRLAGTEYFWATLLGEARQRRMKGNKMECSCCWEALCRKSNRAETDWIWKLGRGWRGLEAFRRRLVSLLYPFSKEEIFGETMYCSWEAMWLLET